MKITLAQMETQAGMMEYLNQLGQEIESLKQTHQQTLQALQSRTGSPGSAEAHQASLDHSHVCSECQARAQSVVTQAIQLLKRDIFAKLGQAAHDEGLEIEADRLAQRFAGYQLDPPEFVVN